jgi:hypothetical protein
MHYVKYTQKAIVSCLPTAAPLRTVLSSRESPRLRYHALTLQIKRKYQRGLINEGAGSARVPDGDTTFESLRAAIPSTRSNRIASQPPLSTKAAAGEAALQSPLSSKYTTKLPPITSQAQTSAAFDRRREDPRPRIKGIALTEHAWHNMSEAELLAQLKNMASEFRLRECGLLARYMIWQRGYKPDREMYASLILANGHTDGSAATVRSLLDQMHRQGISLETAECLTVLKVLAVHPDYVLRAETIQHMERGWHGLSGDTHHLIIAGMLRGLQLEQAVDELEAMVRNDIGVEIWLYDLTVAVLTNVGELEEALRVMRMRLENAGPEGLNPIWTFMLEAAAESFNVGDASRKDQANGLSTP